jgi:alkylation response protein AidB-like acyl-CoA dehydrogenase
MKTQIDATRLLVWRAAWMARQGKPFEASETGFRVTEEAVQIQSSLVGWRNSGEGQR